MLNAHLWVMWDLGTGREGSSFQFSPPPAGRLRRQWRQGTPLEKHLRSLRDAHLPQERTGEVQRGETLALGPRRRGGAPRSSWSPGPLPRFSLLPLPHPASPPSPARLPQILGDGRRLCWHPPFPCGGGWGPELRRTWTGTFSPTRDGGWEGAGQVWRFTSKHLQQLGLLEEPWTFPGGIIWAICLPGSRIQLRPDLPLPFPTAPPTGLLGIWSS